MHLGSVSDGYVIFSNKVTFAPLVNFNTIKRLVSHLAEVAEHSSKNMASIDNLSKIFGPTVFGIDKVINLLGDSDIFE